MLVLVLVLLLLLRMVLVLVLVAVAAAAAAAVHDENLTAIVTTGKPTTARLVATCEYSMCTLNPKTVLDMSGLHSVQVSPPKRPGKVWAALVAVGAGESGQAFLRVPCSKGPKYPHTRYQVFLY